MANDQGPGFIDRHIEKIILAVCVVILLFAVIQYGITTPRRFEVSGPTGQTIDVPPKKVDQQILESTKRLEQRVKSVEADAIPQRNDLAVLNDLQQDPVDMILASLDYGEPLARGLSSGDSGGPADPPTLTELAAAMPKPATPISWTGEELTFTSRFGAGEVAQLNEAKPTWRALTWYPWQKLLETWEQMFRQTVIVPQVVALGYEVQIEIRQPDGSWKPAPDVEPIIIPNPDTGQIPRPPTLPEFTGQNTQEIYTAIDDWVRNGWMAYVLQPPYYDILGSTGERISWVQHLPDLPETYVDDIRDYRQAQATPSEQTGPARTAPTRAPSVAPNRRRSGRRSTGRTPTRAMPPEMMPPGMAGPEGNFPATPRTTDRRPATPEADELAGEEEVVLPELEEQFAIGKPLMWFHTTVDYGQTYRCRFRVRFVNPLITQTKYVNEERPEDARQLAVASPWSDWSQPISVQRDIRFFLTGANPLQRRVTVTIFSTYLGQRVEHRIGNVEPGQEIREQAEVTVYDPITGQPKKADVQFETGAVAIEFDFNREVPTPSGRVRRDGVEMVYLDNEGQLRSRLMTRDRNSATFTELSEQAEQARRRVEPTRQRRSILERREERRRNRPDRRGGPDQPGQFPGGPEGFPGQMPGEMMPPGVPGGGGQAPPMPR
jgi:hypothetical protein